ncbi:hypothetical protein EJ419_00280 [Alloscardovia theropitheci]|uniref:Uncharacterized protein n=1 Tax=Alloscardovia theropitheci TaxID=2496842 RepID=A0A4R0QRS6_9BIFI|nr:hypothetical protein [Alloscardovia theropitheci]TCD55074.1 hypothetical protein EJ419_00280 [Alloscardovia theropitheci]
MVQRAALPLTPSFPETINIHHSSEIFLDLLPWNDFNFTGNFNDSSVIITDKEDKLVGVIDYVYAQNYDGERIRANIKVIDNTLAIKFNKDISGEVHLEYLNATGNDNLWLPSYDRESFIDIPKDYIYNPRIYGGLHDYCTWSPDEFNVLGQRVDFRGPCARHDMCYEKSHCRSRRCDSILHEHLKTNCRVQLNPLNPLRATCLATAEVYFTAVVSYQEADTKTLFRVVTKDPQ